MLGNMSISNTYKSDTEDPVIGVLTLTEVTTTTITLGWAAATDNKAVVGYELYVDGSLQFTLGNVLSKTVTGLTEGVEYDFSIKAFDLFDNRSEFSNIVTAIPNGILPGLTDALITVPAQTDATWTLRSFNISAYLGKQARLVILSTRSSSYSSDNQIDDMKLGSTSWDPEVGTHSFERNSTISSTLTYDAVSWTALATATSGGFWLRDSGGTSSGTTGNTSGHTGSYYFYSEGTGGNTGQKYWLRSPIVTIDNSTLEVWTAQNGSACGQIDIYLDIQ